jgi:hypothetical protein
LRPAKGADDREDDCGDAAIAPDTRNLPKIWNPSCESRTETSPWIGAPIAKAKRTARWMDAGVPGAGSTGKGGARPISPFRPP